nr:FtsQ-type POTRA domain-containing protein [Candidatus Moranbacteria bacterium]
MFARKKQVFREDLYLPKHQVKKVKRGDAVASNKRTFPWLALFLWFCFVGTFVYMLFFSPVMNVEILHVEGNAQVAQSDVEKYFAEEREGVLWHILKRQNYFLFRADALMNRLKGELPAIENVRVEKVFPNKVNIFIEERQLAVLWCSSCLLYTS